MLPSMVTVPNFIWYDRKCYSKDTCAHKLRLKVRVGWARALKCKVGRPRAEPLQTLWSRNRLCRTGTQATCPCDDARVRRMHVLDTCFLSLQVLPKCSALIKTFGTFWHLWDNRAELNSFSDMLVTQGLIQFY